jgi:polyphosphate kinase
MIAAGTSENIRVTRQEEIYLGSANMMPRNPNRRVEVDFPVRDPKLMRFLHDEVLAIYLADVVKARHMKPDGTMFGLRIATMPAS